MSTRVSRGRIGRWSASHPWRALIIWFTFVAACVTLVAAAGTRTLSDGAVGESARGNAIMDQKGLWGAPREYAYLHSAALVSSDPSFAAAVHDVQQRITAPGLRVSETTSADRHSVLVSAGPSQPLTPAEASQLHPALPRIPAALAAARRAHPGLTISETGDISANHAQNRIVNSNLHRVELLAIPVTLLVLLLAHDRRHLAQPRPLRSGLRRGQPRRQLRVGEVRPPGRMRLLPGAQRVVEHHPGAAERPRAFALSPAGR
jgi:RND superfamily putative drug exporter